MDTATILGMMSILLGLALIIIILMSFKMAGLIPPEFVRSLLDVGRFATSLTKNKKDDIAIDKLDKLIKRIQDGEDISTPDLLAELYTVIRDSQDASTR